MNLIDLLLIIIIFGCAWLGFHKGFIEGAIELVVLTISLVVTLLLYDFLNGFVIDNFSSASGWLFPLLLIAVFLLTRLIVRMLTDQLYDDVSDRTQTNKWNMIAGFLPGFLNGVIYATLIMFLLTGIGIEGLKAQAYESSLSHQLLKPAEWLDVNIKPASRP